MSKQQLTSHELAARWDVKTGTLDRWRREKIGPRYLKLNARGTIRYRLEDVEAYEKVTERAGSAAACAGGAA